MFRKITYPAKYPEIEKNTQKKHWFLSKKRKNSLTVTLDTKKKKHFPCLVGNMESLTLNLYHFDMSYMLVLHGVIKVLLPTTKNTGSLRTGVNRMGP